MVRDILDLLRVTMGIQVLAKRFEEVFNTVWGWTLIENVSSVFTKLYVVGFRVEVNFLLDGSLSFVIITSKEIINLSGINSFIKCMSFETSSSSVDLFGIANLLLLLLFVFLVVVNFLAIFNSCLFISFLLSLLLLFSLLLLKL